MNFDTFIDRIIDKEKGFVDHPSDSGGPTNFGITTATARKYGYNGPMQEMPLSFARGVYLNRYIVEPRFDRVALVDADIANELIDTGVNMGQSRAAAFLQRCLNVFNLRGSRYADVAEDGDIGEVTLAALRAFLKFRGDKGRRVLLKALNCVQGVKYIEFAENNESQEDFTFGWFAERIEIPS